MILIKAIAIQKISRIKFDQFLSLKTRIPKHTPAIILIVAYKGPVDSTNPRVLIPYANMRVIVPIQPIIFTFLRLNFI